MALALNNLQRLYAIKQRKQTNKKRNRKAAALATRYYVKKNESGHQTNKQTNIQTDKAALYNKSASILGLISSLQVSKVDRNKVSLITRKVCRW